MSKINRQDFGLPNSLNFPVAIVFTKCREPKRMKFVMFYHDTRLLSGEHMQFSHSDLELEEDIIESLEEQFYMDDRTPVGRREVLWSYKFIHRLEED